jgi:hypothetical protein
MNWQHCSNIIFVGLSHSYEKFYQAVRRCWRFGQEKEVHCYVVTAETEGRVVSNIKRKEKDADRMAMAMAENMREIQKKNIRSTQRHITEYKPIGEMTIPDWIIEEVRL